MKKALLFLSLCSQAWSLSCSTPVTLSEPGQDSYWPKMTMNEKGEALALWIVKKENEETLFAATLNGEKDADKKWSSTQLSGSAKRIYPYKLFLDTEGNSFTLWRAEKEDKKGERSSFYQFAKKQRNTAWSPLVNILGPEEGFSSYPTSKSVFDADRNVLVFGRAKVQHPSPLYSFTQVKIIHYLHQTGQKRKIDYAKDALFTRGECLIRNKEGRVFALWAEYKPEYQKDKNRISQIILRGSWAQLDSSWSDPVNIFTFKDPNEHFSNMKGAMNSDGDLVVLMEKCDSKDIKKLQGITYIDQEWSDPLDFASSKSEFFNHKAVINNKGDIVVGWLSYEEGNDIAYVAQKSKGQPWSAPRALSDASKYAEGPKIALDQEGNIFVIWSMIEGDKRILYAVNKSADQSWSSPVSLSSKNAHCLDAKVCVNKTGHFIVVWAEQQEGTSIHGVTFLPQTQEWSQALLTPKGEFYSDFSFVFNQKGEGMIAWKKASDDKGNQIQAAELKID